MSKIALRTYSEVADLVQQGLTERARALAVTIPVDHVRTKALLLANHSRRL